MPAPLLVVYLKGLCMSTRPPLRIEEATENDIPLILAFIRELAEYERLLDHVTATEEKLRASLFGPEACAEAVIAYERDAPVAFAIYFFSYSTFSGLPNLYLEDILVRPASRGSGVGRQLFAFLARRARERGCQRMEWAVLNWNAPAIGFYEKLGAEPASDWTVFHLNKDELEKLANEG